MIKDYFAKRDINFLKYRKNYLLVSLCIMLVGLLFVLFKGVNLSIKFTGGAMLKYSYAVSDTDVSDSDALVSASDVEITSDDISEVVMEVTSQDSSITFAESLDSEGETKKTFTISLSGKSTISEDAGELISSGLTDKYSGYYSFSLIESNSVNATTGSEFFGKCLMAVFLAALFMIIYVALRFKKIGGMSAAITAIVAILHDCMIVFFAFVIFGFSIDDNFIAVLLTIIGYSINSTIIIFDRVRENREVLGKKAKNIDVVNKSLNDVLGRTINTNLTLILAILAIVIVAAVYGISSIVTFAVPMLTGVISGAYSSMFVSSSLWVLWNEYNDVRLARKKSTAFSKSGKKSRASKSAKSAKPRSK